jgi:hypothetical protein
MLNFLLELLLQILNLLHQALFNLDILIKFKTDMVDLLFFLSDDLMRQLFLFYVVLDSRMGLIEFILKLLLVFKELHHLSLFLLN